MFHGVRAQNCFLSQLLELLLSNKDSTFSASLRRWEVSQLQHPPRKIHGPSLINLTIQNGGTDVRGSFLLLIRPYKALQDPRSGPRTEPTASFLLHSKLISQNFYQTKKKKRRENSLSSEGIANDLPIRIKNGRTSSRIDNRRN